VKKFAWPYQRLLEVKDKQEKALRSELVSLTEETVAVHGHIMMLNMMLRNMLGDLKAGKGSKTRIGQQAEFMRHVHVKDAQIQKLQSELVRIEQKRDAKREEIMKLQKFRKGLERLRGKALDDYRLQINRYEQKELDDNIHSVCTRNILMQNERR
jgi:flagellar export protein FliJ